MAAFVSTAQDVYYDLLFFYAVLTAWVILFYDYLLQFSREVDLVWTRISVTRLSYPMILYLLTRFTAPIAFLINLGNDLKALSPAGRDAKPIVTWLLIMSPCVISVVLGLRTYAIWERNRLVLVILVCVGQFIPLTGILVGTELHGGSHSKQLRHSNVPFRIMLQSLLTLIFDSIVIGLTIGKSIQSRRMFHSSGGFLDMILRDGCTYFIALATGQLINVLTFWFAPRGLVGSTLPPSRAISVVLTARFMLNLQELHNARCRPDCEVMFTGTVGHTTCAAGVPEQSELVHLPVHAPSSGELASTPSNSIQNGDPTVGQGSPC